MVLICVNCSTFVKRDTKAHDECVKQGNKFYCGDCIPEDEEDNDNEEEDKDDEKKDDEGFCDNCRTFEPKYKLCKFKNKIFI